MTAPQFGRILQFFSVSMEFMKKQNIMADHVIKRYKQPASSVSPANDAATITLRIVGGQLWVKDGSTQFTVGARNEVHLIGYTQTMYERQGYQVEIRFN